MHIQVYIHYNDISVALLTNCPTRGSNCKQICAHHILCSNRHNLTLWCKGLRFAGYTVGEDQGSLGKCKNQQTTIILLYSTLKIRTVNLFHWKSTTNYKSDAMIVGAASFPFQYGGFVNKANGADIVIVESTYLVCNSKTFVGTEGSQDWRTTHRIHLGTHMFILGLSCLSWAGCVYLGLVMFILGLSCLSWAGYVYLGLVVFILGVLCLSWDWNVYLGLVMFILGVLLFIVGVSCLSWAGYVYLGSVVFILELSCLPWDCRVYLGIVVFILGLSCLSWDCHVYLGSVLFILELSCLSWDCHVYFGLSCLSWYCHVYFWNVMFKSLYRLLVLQTELATAP